MKNFFTIFGIVTALFISSLSAHAQQPLEVDLDTVKTYRNLEKALENPEEVYVLKLSGKKIKKFPVEITQLVNLRELDMSKNKLKEIPDTIRVLQHLTYLNLSKNKLNEISKGICALVNLTYLDMSQNRILGFPEEIGQLRNLQKMDMWRNDIGEFPNELALLKKLELMDLRSIQMSEDEQARIKTLLPKTEIHFSRSCNCDY